MDLQTKDAIRASVQNFKLPDYTDIPDIGLYLDQTATYVAERLSPLQSFSITPSMISNYVKMGLIDKPEKKLYHRDQIAYLLFIAVAKSVLSLDALTGFIKLQQQTYSLPKAYDYFCDQLESLLLYTFEVTDTLQLCGEDNTDEKRLLFTCMVAAVQKVYLEKCREEIANED